MQLIDTKLRIGRQLWTLGILLLVDIDHVQGRRYSGAPSRNGNKNTPFMMGSSHRDVIIADEGLVTGGNGRFDRSSESYVSGF